jgi:sporulation protein YabP
MQEKQLIDMPHNFILENRSRLVLNGIHDVGSFNDGEVVVYTTRGELKIKGRELHIIRVSVESGDMELNGKIDSLVYSDNIKRVPDNFITKLFK